jgi:hypothetical protein
MKIAFKIKIIIGAVAFSYGSLATIAISLGTLLAEMSG